MSSGKVVQVIGPVVDVEFPLDEKLPEINDALQITESDDKTLTTEVALELGDGVVRTIAMDGTDGLQRQRGYDAGKGWRPGHLLQVCRNGSKG